LAAILKILKTKNTTLSDDLFLGQVSKGSFMKLCRNIHRSVWQLLGGLKNFKMAAVAMVTKMQKMLNSLQTVDPFET
jgi:hypothetical protein